MASVRFKPADNGTFSLFLGSKPLLLNQPLGLAIKDKKLYYPLSAELKKNRIVISFECGNITLSYRNCKYYERLEVTEADDMIDMFIFGCYHTDMMNYGEILGAAWDDKKTTALCIQSLNPKTVGGFKPEYYYSLYPRRNETRITPNHRESAPHCASLPVTDGCDLICHAENMTRPLPNYADGMENSEVSPIEGPDVFIKGAAIALVACRYEELLDRISDLEIAEGLPHPMKDGIWAKKNPRTSESYMMISGGTKENLEKSFEWVKKAGMKCLYSWGQFKSWGHFEMLPSVYDGDEGFRKSVEYAKSKGIESGFHTLSNFINTNDPYVEGKPDDRLLVMDRTVILEDIDESATSIVIRDKKNFGKRSNLNCIRMGDELATFEKLDESDDKLTLVNVTRGAYKTTPAAHKKGDELLRLFDHGYKTLFPNLELQHEMGQRVASLMKYAGISRMSFDGLEGCLYTGRGEYACSKYTDDCYKIFGDSVLCDASMPSHYRWHIHSYFNWGEPYYDYPDRGGMPAYRAGNQEFFERNFMPRMLGQYKIMLAYDRFEATSLENFEHTLSSTVAWDAGFGLDTAESVLLKHGLTDELLDAVRIWSDLRFNGDIPQSLRDEMKDEYAEWHVEETDNGWDVFRMHNQDFHLRYNNRGSDGEFSSTMCIDRVTIKTPFTLKIRVGSLAEKGAMTKFAIHGGWGGYSPIVSFEGINIPGGHYLLFDGKNTLTHLDENYHFIETITGKGDMRGPSIHSNLSGYDARWRCTEDATISPVATFRHPLKITHIKRKQQ